MKSRNKFTKLLSGISTAVVILSFARPAIAVDDGARAYWKLRDGTNVVSFQYLNLGMQASGTQQFDPTQYIYLIFRLLTYLRCNINNLYFVTGNLLQCFPLNAYC